MVFIHENDPSDGETAYKALFLHEKACFCGEVQFSMLTVSTKIAASVDKGESMCRYKRNCRPENHFCGRQSVRAIFMFN